MAAILGASSRTCAQLGKAEPSVRCQANVRVARQSRRAFKGSRRSVKVSAADKAAPAPAPAPEQQAAAPQGQRGQRRQQRTVTVDLADVKPGDVFDATVTSVEAYGAFVNIGARTDGLVHVSQLTDGFVKNTADVVKVGDAVKVKVLTVDAAASRLALSMKGMSPRSSGNSSQYADDGADDAEDDEPAPLEDNEAIFEGTFFRIEDVDEPIDEADEWELEQDADVATALTLASHDMVTGRVISVEDFGVIMEFEAGGKTLQGLLHVSEMRAPATALAAAEGTKSAATADDADSAAVHNPSGLFGDEAEYLEEEYEDVGGVDSPSQYYKIGDTISAFVLDVEGEKKVSLTQFMSADEMPSNLAAEEEGEADLLEQLDGQEPVGFYDDDDDEDSPATNIPAYEAAQVTAGVYYGMQRTYPERAVAGFIAGKRDGSVVVPGAFPDRAVQVRDSVQRVPASGTNEDDDGEESELIDFWTDDSALPKNVLKRLGYKIGRDEAGEMEVVAREKAPVAEGEEAPEEESLYDLLNMADDADINAIVDALLAEETEEAELPYLAGRSHRVFAMTVETGDDA